jgi:hypothetical protein
MKMVVGIQIQMSVELMTMELGTSNQPFLQDYQEYSDRVTDGFCKSLWEKLRHFRFELVLKTAIF